jgi:hypothetical protein
MYVSMVMTYVVCDPDEAEVYFGILKDLVERMDDLDSEVYELMNAGDRWKHAYEYLEETGRDYFTNEVVFEKK